MNPVGLARAGAFAVAILLQLLLTPAGEVFAADVAAPVRPVWWESTLGTAPVVLPGFEPMRTSGTRVELGGRSYVWDDSFLPVRIDSLGRQLTHAVEIVAAVGAERHVWRPNHVEVRESQPDHVLVVATGEPLPGLKVTCSTRVEYDGVAMVKLELVPDEPIAIDGLYNEILVTRNKWSRVIAFSATSNPRADGNIRYMRKQNFLGPNYRGAFQNVVGFADGDRSFWWFADNAVGWIWNGAHVTEVSTDPEAHSLRQHLIGGAWRIDQPMTFDFNFLATPVRDIGSRRRKEHVVHHLPASDVNRGKFHFWWPDAFSYFVLPYSDAPAEILDRFPKEERDAFPGRERILELMRGYLAEDFHRLPYFSGHCLALFDPALERYRSQWETEPTWIHAYGGETPCLSHRAEGYSNYLLHRLDREIDILGMTGIYLDQGAPVDSRNPAHGEWIDSNGKRQASLDILAYRDFLKRLRVLFHEKGKPGYIVAHNSNAEVIPALTFVTTTLDGEQYRKSLVDEDYVETVSLDRARILFSGTQYGVPNTWLPTFYPRRKNDREWEVSGAQLRAYRNLMALALLHDIPLQPVGVHRNDYGELIRRLDDFGIADSEFIGYWREHPGVRVEGSDAWASAYVRNDRSRALVVLSNLDSRRQQIGLSVDPAELGLKGKDFSYRILPLGPKPLPEDGPQRVSVPGKNFHLIEYGEGL